MFFADNGDCYFTDFEGSSLQTPNGSVYRLSAAGKLECLIDNIPGPNGIVLNLTETAIFVAVTFANAVWRCPINENGSIGKVGAFVNLSGGVGPDGLALDEDGNLSIAHAGMGRVWVVSPIGEPLWTIKAERGGFLTNIAYGGPDRTTPLHDQLRHRRDSRRRHAGSRQADVFAPRLTPKPSAATATDALIIEAAETIVLHSSVADRNMQNPVLRAETRGGRVATLVRLRTKGGPSASATRWRSASRSRRWSTPSTRSRRSLSAAAR